MSPIINSNTTKIASVESYSKLLEEFIAKKGKSLQKTFIKKLWSVHEDLIENVSLSELRMMFFSPELACCSEGVKLLAAFIQKIGAVASIRLVEKLIVQYGATNVDCKRYGEVFQTAWTTADVDEDYVAKEELEKEVISTICYNSIYAKKPHNAKFREMLIPFANEKKKNKSLEEMITSRLNGCLYTGLSAENDIVRGAAASVFFLFYPLVDEEVGMQECIEKQSAQLEHCLLDVSTTIRTEAVKKTLKVLSEFWLVIPKDILKNLMSLIIDRLSRDSVVSVRTAVFEGMTYLAFVPACMNAFEHALKCICLRGINDRSDRVRLAAFDMLGKLKGHRFISVFDIVSRDEIIARLDIEPVEMVRKQIITIMHMLLPIKQDLDESYYRPRVNYILGKSRMALLTYFRLLFPMGIISTEMTAKLIEMLILWAYRYLRKKDGPPLAEDSEGYKRARIYLEAALVLFSSARGSFLTPEFAKQKTKLEAQYAKLIKEIFSKYRDTPIMGTATAMCGAISKANLKSIGTDVFGMLEEENIPEEAVEPFLESASHFNVDGLLDFFESGLSGIPELVQQIKSQKFKKSTETKIENLSKCVRFLTLLIKSHNTCTLISSREIYRLRLSKFSETIDSIRDMIDLRLNQDPTQTFPIDDATLLSALQLRFILPVYCVSNAADSEDVEKERGGLNESIKSLLSWFNLNVASQMNTFQDENHQFLIELTKSLFECTHVILSSWNFTTPPLDVDEDKEEPEEPENTETVAEIIAKIIISFCNSSTPIVLLCPVLKAAINLCEKEYEECHAVMMNVLSFIPKWLKRHCESDEEIPIDEKEVTDSLRTFYRRISEMNSWTEQEAKFVKNIALLTIVFLTDAAEEEEQFADPQSNDYKPSQWVSVMIVKFAVKEQRLAREVLYQIHSLLNSESFIGPDHPINVCLVRLGAVAQMILLMKKFCNYEKQSIQTLYNDCKEKVKSYFEQDLDEVDGFITNSLTNLFELESEMPQFAESTME